MILFSICVSIIESMNATGTTQKFDVVHQKAKQIHRQQHWEGYRLQVTETGTLCTANLARALTPKETSFAYHNPGPYPIHGPINQTCTSTKVSKRSSKTTKEFT